jgi:peroxiredoxin
MSFFDWYKSTIFRKDLAITFMALTESYMLPLQIQAPNFSLCNVVTGQNENLEGLKGEKGTLIIFMCNHCPYVVYLLDSLIDTARRFDTMGVKTIAISSNSVVSHPQDGPEYMKQLALEKKFPFPYLYDSTQEIAHQYQAACTPDFYLFDSDLKLVYRGRYDDARPGNEQPISGHDLHRACEKMLKQKPIQGDQFPSMGCNIKWFPGNSPEERI